MGYISNSSNINVCSGSMDINWTPLGRQYLMNFGVARNKSQIFYFSLADSDTNYFNFNEPAANFIPDLTGDHTLCLLPTADSNVRNPLTVDDLNPNNIIDYRTKGLKSCIPLDCEKYYDMFPLLLSDTRSSDSVSNIWDCIVGNFEGSLV